MQSYAANNWMNVTQAVTGAAHTHTDTDAQAHTSDITDVFLILTG